MAIKKLPEVEQVQLNEPFELKPAIAPNDPAYTSNSQWHLNDPVNTTADIDAPQAWDINRGRNDVIVAILDGGVDYNHPDMDLGNRSRVIAGIDTGDGDNDPLDDLPYGNPISYAGHGTSVAGIVGAITNNNNQVAGIMWNCKIMPVKMVGTGNIKFPFVGTVVDFVATAFPNDVANAIDYAVNNGAHVINLSYGFHSIGFPIDQVILKIPLLFQTLDNAYRNNVVTCAAMGNEFLTDNSTSYPAGFSEQVIPVGASDRNRQRVNFSNTGSHISVAAPGVGIITTDRGGSVRSFNGTSASSPVVAGIAGLIISQGKDRNFNLTNNDVKHIMELTAVDVIFPSVGFDNDTGFGIVNANNALRLLASPNVLYHYVASGGTSTKISTIPQWILLDNRWGLAAATYFNVDQYKITNHVTFDIPFCSPPKVWMRERESLSLDYGNPNFGRPKSFITNITTTGFDLEYLTYFVKFSTTGAEINKWVPASPANTLVAYTAVGQPNPAALVTISGASLICSSATFSTANNPNNFPVTWSSSNPSDLSINATTGAATRVNNFNGPVTISATISGGCGIVNVAKNVWVGNPEITGSISGSSYATCANTYIYSLQGGINGSSSWIWQASDHFTKSTSGSNYFLTPIYSGEGYVSVEASNICGNTNSCLTICADGCDTGLLVFPGSHPCYTSGQCGFSLMSVYPNPSSGSITIKTNLALDKTVTKNLYEVVVHDEKGHKILNQNMDKEEFIIDKGVLKTGTYYVKIYLQGKLMDTKRVTVN